jgi:hypothetical protein
MWTALRTRAPRVAEDLAHRLRGLKGGPGALPDGVDDLRDVAFTLRRADLETLATALAGSLGTAVAIDSPARLEAALVSAILGAGGHGSVEVSRSPRAIRMPELWTVRITAADRLARATLEDLVP